MIPCAHNKKRGFTLVELMVSLVGGMVVAMSVVALSKSATATVFEEARTAAAQMSVRAAMDRLRADLARASYMSTGNIQADNTLTKDPLQTDIPGSAPAGFPKLAGVRLFSQGSYAAGAAPLAEVTGTQGLSSKQIPTSGVSAIRPDAIQITGNMASNESFIVEDRTTDGLCAGGTRLLLGKDTAAVYRVKATGTSAQQAALLKSMFIPVSITAVTPEFFVRLTNLTTGKFAYLVACDAGIDTSGYAYVDINSTETPLPLKPLGTWAGVVMVNPVQTVRWELSVSPDATLNVPVDPGKYDLLRYYVDATGTAVGAPETVAEYAVDLKFGFTVDDATAGSGNAKNGSLLTLDFTNVDTPKWAADVTVAQTPANLSPSRIRAVRFRLATRSRQPDRKADLTSPVSGYLYRYCVTASGACKDWVRVRTLVSEVALHNQARMYYP